MNHCSANRNFLFHSSAQLADAFVLEFIRIQQMVQTFFAFFRISFGNAIQIMMAIILEKFGVAPDKMEQMLNQYSDENIPAAPQQMGA